MARRPDAQNPLAILYASHMLKHWGYDPAQFADPTAAWRQLSAQLAGQGAFTPHPQAYTMAMPDMPSQPAADTSSSPSDILARIVSMAQAQTPVEIPDRYPSSAPVSAADQRIATAIASSLARRAL